MLSVQTIFLLLFSFYVLCSLFLYTHYISHTPSRIASTEDFLKPTAPPFSLPFEFKDHITAYYILQELDTFEPVDIKYINVSKGAQEDYTRPMLGLKIDEDYCLKHRAYFVSNPGFIFEEQNFLVSHKNESLLRGHAIPLIGKDAHPEIGGVMPTSMYYDFLYDMKIDVTNYFTQSELYTHRSLGKQFSCLTQMSNHLPGHENLYRKDFVTQALVRYAKVYEDRPQCFSYDKFFPKSWVMYQPAQCKQFFKELNSPEYQVLKEERKIVYIRKIGAFVHKGLGVSPVNEKEEEHLRTVYGNGTLCGQTRKHYVVQYFVHNPLLIDNRKFDFRVFMLIASTNPLIVFYHDGYVKVSLHSYNTEAEHRGALLTNTFLNEEFFSFAKNNGTYEGMNEDELRDYHIWNFTRLHDYIYGHGLTSDPDWLDNYFRRELKKAMIHLVRMSQSTYLQTSSVYELLGLDMMLDSNLNLWFIEANASPGLDGFSPNNKLFLKKMIIDHFEIVTGLLRSRTKRIIQYMNKIILEGDAWKIKIDKVYIIDLEERRKEFKELTKNSFEPEFKPSEGNLFSRIIDENLSGTDKYFGLINEECL